MRPAQPPAATSVAPCSTWRLVRQPSHATASWRSAHPQNLITGLIKTTDSELEAAQRVPPLLQRHDQRLELGNFALVPPPLARQLLDVGL